MTGCLSRVSADGGLQVDLAVPECEPGSSQRHLFAIRVNVTLASGESVAGPWSEPTQQLCVLVSDWPTATIVGVVVGGAVLMMVVVLLFFVLCHRTKRKLSEMRNLGVNMPAGLERPEKGSHGFAGGPDGGYGRLVSQNSAGTERTAASVSGQPVSAAPARPLLLAVLCYLLASAIVSLRYSEWECSQLLRRFSCSI